MLHIRPGETAPRPACLGNDRSRYRPGWPKSLRTITVRRQAAVVTGAVSESPGVQPRVPQLTETDRQQAMARWQLLRPVVEDGVALAAAARERRRARADVAPLAGGLPRGRPGRAGAPAPLGQGSPADAAGAGAADRGPGAAPPAAYDRHGAPAGGRGGPGAGVAGAGLRRGVRRGAEHRPGDGHARARGRQAVQGGVRPGAPPRGRQAERDLAGRPHPAGPVGAHPVRQAGTAVADPDRGRSLPGGRRVRGQPGRPVGADHRAGVPPGDLAQALARLARVRHPRMRSTSTTARTSPLRTWSR